MTKANPTPQPPKPAGAITHGRCGRWWLGTRTAHCGSCCREFSGTTAFDDHWRAGSGNRCGDPAAAGLVPVERPWGEMWGAPGAPPAFWLHLESDEVEASDLAAATP